MYSQLIVAALPALALAAPQFGFSVGVSGRSSSPQTKDVSYTATFEDRQANAVTPLGNEVGSYAGLSYNNFGLFGQAVQGQGLQPNTIPNTAAWGSITATLLAENDATLTSSFDGSTVQSFDLESLYFGCAVATQESTINLASSCTVKFTAQDKEGSNLAVKSVDFDGSNEMQFVQFGSQFEKVYQVVFSVEGFLESQLVVGSTDTLKYTVHQSQ